jgi:hypothetical protein
MARARTTQSLTWHLFHSILIVSSLFCFDPEKFPLGFGAHKFSVLAISQAAASWLAGQIHIIFARFTAQAWR